MSSHSLAEPCDKDGNPVFSFEPITDYLECHFAGLLNLEALMGDGIAKHIYSSWLAEGGKPAALLSDPRTYKEAMKQPDAEQWKEVINAEFAQLERLKVFSEPCWLSEGCYAIKTRTLFKKKRFKTRAVER